MKPMDHLRAAHDQSRVTFEHSGIITFKGGSTLTTITYWTRDREDPSIRVHRYGVFRGERMVNSGDLIDA